jgi:hypothetical protein
VARGAEQKRALAADFDSVEFSSGHPKDALGGIVRVGSLQPQATEGSPDEIEMSVHESTKARGIRRERLALAESGIVRILDGRFHRSDHS